VDRVPEEHTGVRGTGLRGELIRSRPSEPDPGHAGAGRSRMADRREVVAIGRLHVITDTRVGGDALAVATAAVEAGAPVVQVRGKDLSDRALYELTCRIADVCH